VETAEHLLASLYALGITDAVVVPEGREIPILDGSALPFVEAIRAVGLREVPGAVAPIRPLVPLDVSDPERGRTLILLPGPGLVLDYTIDYPGTPLGRRRFALTVDPLSFAERIAPARTFGFEAEAEALRARGLARGASLENTLVYGPSGVLNPGGERFSQEPPAHKALDLLGDLALLGAPLEGRIVAVGAGHDLHLRLAARLRRVSGDRPQNRKRREIE
jgi:UDP-3-O-[3-hydroxymyristoyl] N-acetylglucosamine deacetylase